MWVNNFFQRKREQKYKYKLHIKDLIVATAEVHVDFSFYVQSVVSNMIIKIAKIIRIARPLIF